MSILTFDIRFLFLVLFNLFICFLLLFLHLFVFGVALTKNISLEAKSCPPRAKIHVLQKKNGTVLNRVLTLAVARSRRELSESSGIIEKGAICVELWSFYCKKRISVPMSYTTFLHSSKIIRNMKI